MTRFKQTNVFEKLSLKRSRTKIAKERNIYKDNRFFPSLLLAVYQKIRKRFAFFHAAAAAVH
jgi:hypothetical protein